MAEDAQDKRSSWLSDRRFSCPGVPSCHDGSSLKWQKHTKKRNRPREGGVITNPANVVAMERKAADCAGRPRLFGLFQRDVRATEVETILPCLWAGDKLEWPGTFHGRVHRYRQVQQIMASKIHQEEAV